MGIVINLAAKRSLGIAVKGQVTLIDQEGKEQVFDSLVECGRFLNAYRKRISRYANKDKLLIPRAGPW